MSGVVVLPGRPLAATLAFFRERLQFRLESIRPADDPAVAILSRGGLRVCLDVAHEHGPGTLRIDADEDREETAPNGTVVQFRRPFALRVPEARGAAVVTRRRDADDWVVGRAGMRYRDLVPSRLGGHLIASHIRIDDGGPVPDDVHCHDVRCQLIYCVRGWVRLVYEDQGEPFVLRAGECVLQPPTIRHRVLACSAGLEVVELACPAEHQTTLDHDVELPTANVDPTRSFAGQRFHVHRHRREVAVPAASTDLGLLGPTDGIVDARVEVGDALLGELGADARVTFGFVLQGAGEIAVDGRRHRVGEGDAFAAPAGVALMGVLADVDTACLLVRVAVPGATA